MNMKKIAIWLLIVLVAIFLLGVIKDGIIKEAVTVTISQVTGAPVHIDGFSLGIFSQTVKISGLKMYNPKGFPRGILVDLPRINVTYDLGAFFAGKLHLVNLEVVLKELGLEKNKEGKLNVDSLKVAKQGETQEKPAKQMAMQIDTIKLGMGRIVSKDYSGPGEPVVNVYDININKTYKNITSAQQLAALILVEPMKAAGIRSAKIYGAAMLAGAAVLPVAAAFTLAGKDSAQQNYALPFDKVYDASLEVLKKKGAVKREDKSAGVISGSVSSTEVYFKIIRKTENDTQVVVSARKYFLPKPEIASGILYEVSEKLK